MLCRWQREVPAPVIVRIRGKGLNVPEVTVSGGGGQARTDASISRVPRRTGGGLGFLGQSLMAREMSATRLEEDLPVLTDEDGVALVVRQRSVYCRVVTQQLQAVFAADRFVKAA